MDPDDEEPQYYKYLVALAVETVSSRWDLRPQNEVKTIKLKVVSAKKKEVVEVYNVAVENGALQDGIEKVDGFFRERGLVFPDFVFVLESRWPLDSCIKLEAACKQISLKEKHWCYFMDLRIESLKAGLISTDLAGIADDLRTLHNRSNPVDTISNVICQLLEKQHKFKSPQVVTNSLLSTMQQLWLEGGSEKDDVKTAIEEYSAVVVTGIPESEREHITVEMAQDFMKPVFVPFENIVLKPATPGEISLQIFYLMPDKPTWLSVLAFYKKTWKNTMYEIDVLPVCLQEVSDAGWKGVPPPRPTNKKSSRASYSHIPPSPAHVDPYTYSCYATRSGYGGYLGPDPYGYPPIPPTSTGLSPYVVFLKGLPYSANELEVAEFLYGVDIRYQGIHLVCTGDDKSKGMCFVELNSYHDMMVALERDHYKIGNRSVQVLRSSDAELAKVFHRAAKVGAPFPDIPALSHQFSLAEDCPYYDKYQPSPYSSAPQPSPYYSNYLAYIPHSASCSRPSSRTPYQNPAARDSVPTSPSEPQNASNNESSNGSLTS
eukprot:TRINITY_DN7283_c0_g1_i1.p1 TRINITY_DN7283_c0_g1~~TRINITY_DN7283_c0_g1_i1.p1  ORF type:complete len:545 (+),score=86.80 TRINITY_DN7283_c0_g1_i1:334-1968(+)